MDEIKGIPKTFVTFCRVNEIPDSKMAEAWDRIITESLKSFFTFLAEIISNDDVNKLDKDLKEKDNSETVTNFIKSLPEEQKQKASEKIAEILAENINGFYQAIGRKMTMEQRQVVNAYQNTKA